MVLQITVIDVHWVSPGCWQPSAMHKIIYYVRAWACDTDNTQLQSLSSYVCMLYQVSRKDGLLKEIFEQICHSICSNIADNL